MGVDEGVVCIGFDVDFGGYVGDVDVSDPFFPAAASEYEVFAAGGEDFPFAVMEVEAVADVKIFFGERVNGDVFEFVAGDGVFLDFLGFDLADVGVVGGSG